jgi:hypothetical protein
VIDPTLRAVLKDNGLNHAVVCDHDKGLRSRGAVEGATYVRSDAEVMCAHLNLMYASVHKDAFIVVDL